MASNRDRNINVPKFARDFGVGGTRTQNAFNLLNDVLSAQGSTRNDRTGSTVARRGGDQDVLARLRAREAGISDTRKIQDLALTEKALVKPALNKRVFDLQKLQSEIAKQGGNVQVQNQFFKGLGDTAALFGSAWQEYQTTKNNRPSEPAVEVPNKFGGQG